MTTWNDSSSALVRTCYSAGQQQPLTSNRSLLGKSTVQIPLDYYRILGLPIQATDEQLRHAHRDRTLQLPRREYSEAAIAARRELIDEAYAVLSDPAQRRTYDSRFLATSYDQLPLESDAPQPQPLTAGRAGTNESELPAGSESDSADHPTNGHVSSIEIDDSQFVGALLILLELGEYELVLKLGRPFLKSGSIGLTSGKYGDPGVVGADIVLTVALACLELGREQWQQGLYENAAESLETGQELLLREGLFAGVRGDMQADLFKLRPYRILELLALPLEHQSGRHQGILLLQDMLNERGGIDGSGNDQSGLSTDDFLRFVQQLRTYLTSEEQQHIFEAEASRPSAVAMYLAVYALIARGFSYRLPALLRQAKLFLTRLGTRQDIALELAICALLLGQTEKATESLDRSKEYSALAFIREHSKGSPDLLPGLCLYAERWLQNEVFPHFRDLAQTQVSLKEFFADEHVQAYLEALPNEPETDAQWEGFSASTWSMRATNGMASSYGIRQTYDQKNGIGASSYGGSTATATLNSAKTYTNGPSNGTSTLPMAQRVSPVASDTQITSTPPETRRSPRRGLFGRRRRSSKRTLPPPVDATQMNGSNGSAYSSRRSSKSANPRLDRMVFLAAISVVGILIVWTVISRILGWLNNNVAGPWLEGEQLAITVSEPFMPIPDPAALEAEMLASEAEGALNEALAEEVIGRWFEAKSLAMGENHDLEALDNVLTGSLLTRWQNQSRQAADANWYWEYEHPRLDITSVSWSEDQPEQATVEATVQEVGEYYVGGQLNMAETYDSSLNVRYGLVRDNGTWKIESIEALNE